MFSHPRTSPGVRRQEFLSDQGRVTPPPRRGPGRPRRAAPYRPGPSARPVRSTAGKGSQPLTAVLQDVAATGCSADGTTFAVLELLDASQSAQLALVTSETFGDIAFLQLLVGMELRLDASRLGLGVLPLAQQSKAVRQYLLDQLISRYRQAAAIGDDDTIAAEQLVVFMNQVMGGG